MVITKTNNKEIKRKTLNIDYDIARDLEKKAVELEKSTSPDEQAD